jgi:deoxyribonuclease V
VTTVGAVVRETAGAPFEPRLLALREGLQLEKAVRALPRRAHVLLVDATGRDHPRHAGLALQLGAVGVTHRGLLAASKWPADEPSATAPLVLGAELVGWWVGGSRGRRALAVYAARRTYAEIAVEVVVTARRMSTREPRRTARTAARVARAEDAASARLR